MLDIVCEGFDGNSWLLTGDGPRLVATTGCIFNTFFLNIDNVSFTFGPFFFFGFPFDEDENPLIVDPELELLEHKSGLVPGVLDTEDTSMGGGVVNSFEGSEVLSSIIITDGGGSSK